MLAQLAGPWRMFLVTGAAWLIISAVVLRLSIAPVAAVGVLTVRLPGRSCLTRPCPEIGSPAVLRTPKLTVYSVNMNDRPPATSRARRGRTAGQHLILPSASEIS